MNSRSDVGKAFPCTVCISARPVLFCGDELCVRCELSPPRRLTLFPVFVYRIQDEMDCIGHPRRSGFWIRTCGRRNAVTVDHGAHTRNFTGMLGWNTWIWIKTGSTLTRDGSVARMHRGTENRTHRIYSGPETGPTQDGSAGNVSQYAALIPHFF